MTTSQQTAPAQAPPWSTEDAAELYQIDTWGIGYFAVNAAGRVVVRPDKTPDSEIDLYEVVRGLRERDLEAPVLLRFSDLLAHRLRQIHTAFTGAITDNDYRGGYIAAYPIKVNQQRPVVEEVLQYGRELGFGLEVGSKPELLAVMALANESPARLIVCNGFKDDTYLEGVVLATKLGRRIIPVIENLTELRLILKHADRYGVRPRLGVRVKLASQGAGRWKASSGEKSKFGLFITEVLEMLRILNERGMADCLELVHCHAGSQLHDIDRVKDAVGELAHVYAELVRLGAGVRYIDAGGGLGVDYDGTQSNFPSSMNYTLEQYASEVVYRIASVCNDRKVAHPTIITESGRAIAAYQSVLVFNVLGCTGLGQFRAPANGEFHTVAGQDPPRPIRDLLAAYESVSEETLLECYHDSVRAREEALHSFNLGFLRLEHRGLAERLFWATCAKVHELSQTLEEKPEELDELGNILSETYFCNFSVFQSMPDSWAIDQLFPIMPIHRLDERPARKAVLADITCDSDGKIDRFVGTYDTRTPLDVHDLHDDEDYYLGAFLVGAYQETLGDLHNLFGDTHVVHIRLHERGGWWIEETVKGDTAAEVLAYVQYDPGRLYPMLSRDCEQAVRDGSLTLAESRTLLRFYETQLNAYTYLQPE